MRKRFLYQDIARKISAISYLQEKFEIHKNSEERINIMDKIFKHTSYVDFLVKEKLPSGSGFNAGTKINWDMSTQNKLVFETAFHHMDEAGYYVGWTEHRIFITPDLCHGFNMRITGKDRNSIKEYISDVFFNALLMEVE